MFAIIARYKLILALAVVLIIAIMAAIYFQLRHSNQAGSGVGIHKIKHVIIVMQENRSFDSYFGTFPGADGIPMQNGVPTVCVPDPTARLMLRPTSMAAA